MKSAWQNWDFDRPRDFDADDWWYRCAFTVPPSAKKDNLVLEVVSNVRDEDDDVRGAAFRALGRIRDISALPRLIEALDSPEASLPPRIAEIIVMYGDDAVRPLIKDMATMKDLAPGQEAPPESSRWYANWRVRYEG